MVLCVVVKSLSDSLLLLIYAKLKYTTNKKSFDPLLALLNLFTRENIKQIYKNINLSTCSSVARIGLKMESEELYLNSWYKCLGYTVAFAKKANTRNLKG